MDGPLANDTITYGYDELGRVTSRSINGAANAASMVYDALGRMQAATNPLGSFAYAYVNATGRLDHIDQPGGQKNQYAYFDHLGDDRLKQIKNLNPSGGIISQFDYLYNPVGNITSWTLRQGGAATSSKYTLGYDGVDQLRNAPLIKTQGGTVLKQSEYEYDAAGNRTLERSFHNELNQLVLQSGGGEMHFRGTVDEPAVVTVGGKAARVDGAGNFDGVAEVTPGGNTVPVVATDGNGNSRTSNYQVTVTGGAARTLSYDANGNLTDDGSKTYEWDAANRLVAINYANTSNRTELSYDGLSRRVKIVEKTGNSVTSTKRFVWDGLSMAEERNNTNKVTRKHYAQGVQFLTYNPNTSTSYFYQRDHLGSVREMTDSTGAIKARYDFDPWGDRTKTSGGLDADFGFTGHYYHAPSNLHLAPYRGYDSTVGRWLSRDPIGEAGGLNLYGYVSNNPACHVDLLGLWHFTIYGGAGWGGYLSFGYSPTAAQWNISVRGGGGEGLSAIYDPTDRGCQQGGFVPLSVAASVGNLVGGVGGELTAGPDAVYANASGRLGFTGVTVSGNVGGQNGNTFNPPSGFFGNSDTSSFRSPLTGPITNTSRPFKLGASIFVGAGWTFTGGG